MRAANVRTGYLAAAVIIAVTISSYSVWALLSGALPGEGMLQVYGVVTGILVVSWLATDPRIPVAQRPSFDHGMLLWIAFPVFAIYQMYAAHRWRGILIVIGLLALLAAPNIAMAIAYAARG